MRVAALIIVILLAGCGAEGEQASSQQAPDLETAAIARGLVDDPDEASPEGLFARETDRVCVVANGDAFRIGATTDFGDGVACNASGSATRSGNRLTIRFGDACRIEADFHGDHIVFPARMPDGCISLCRGRASLAALDVARLSDSASEARAMRGANSKLLCATS